MVWWLVGGCGVGGLGMGDGGGREMGEGGMLMFLNLETYFPVKYTVY